MVAFNSIALYMVLVSISIVAKLVRSEKPLKMHDTDIGRQRVNKRGISNLKIYLINFVRIIDETGHCDVIKSVAAPVE